MRATMLLLLSAGCVPPDETELENNTTMQNDITAEWQDSAGNAATDEEVGDTADDEITDERKEELWVIAERYYNGDEEALAEVTIWEEAEIVIEYLMQMEQKEEDAEDETNTGIPVSYWSSGLPDCGYFYSHTFDVTWAVYTIRGTGYTFDWTANCYMSEREDACGGDGDNLVSFWMGPDYVCPTAESPYTVYGTKSSISAWLYYKQYLHSSGSGSANTRIYYGTGGTYANAYFCLPTLFNPENLHLGW